MRPNTKFRPDDITRRHFLTVGTAGLLSVPALAQTAAQAAEAAVSPIEAKTRYGTLRGTRTVGLTTFRGVPYAGSVSGVNRFKAAPPLQPWEGVRDATHFGAPSPQAGRQARGDEPAPAEDCLFLNVWTPAPDGRKRPVMFYSHGGGFTGGSAGTGYQDGSNLAKTWDVVVVATNHRLGIMGYLYLDELGGAEYATSGNQGLTDICDGLRWVHENIAAFGGDPGNVMIFGESGGGAKTSCLYAMPSAAPYFNKASIESGPGIRIYPKASAAETTEMILKQLGIAKADWRKLLDVPLEQLIAVQVELGKQRSGPLTQTGDRNGISGNPVAGGFGPVLDGTILPNDPFYPGAPDVSKNKPLIVGYNHDEMNFFFAERHATDVYELTDATLRTRLEKDLGANASAVLDAYKKSRPDASPADLYVAITTARFAGTGETTIAERKFAQGGAPVYSYVFMHASSRLIPGTQHTMGAAHAAEIVYKFNNVQPRPAQPSAGATPQGGGPMAEPPPSEADIQAARNMSEFWSTFARTGHPAAKGQPVWPAFNDKTRATMLIDTQCKVVDDPNSGERRVWESLPAV